jgi:hypothetical protein
MLPSILVAFCRGFDGNPPYLNIKNDGSQTTVVPTEEDREELTT